MNRVILIGNGFDLAHGLKTSYQDFLEDFWKKVINRVRDSRHGSSYEDDDIYIKRSPSRLIENFTYEDLKVQTSRMGEIVKVKNDFLRIISERKFISKWVDVENEYYDLLKGSYKPLSPGRRPSSNIDQLNIDFKDVKIKLRNYLIDTEQNFKNETKINLNAIKNEIGNKIYHPFDIRDFSEISINNKAELEYEKIKIDLESIDKNLLSLDELESPKRNLIERIDRKNPLKSVREILTSPSAINYFDLIPEKTLLLNFNYTSTSDNYYISKNFNIFNCNSFSQTSSIHIHGTVLDAENSQIIFGFGDEIDEDYKEIEKLNDNKYLENIKSIKYLESDNYKGLLEFINSSNFQVFIFGHSCGISDRTMLNTIFEHDNCASIKAFYHKRASDDNFSDLMMNISRNFNDKSKMRDRVVNKMFCLPLLGNF